MSRTYYNEINPHKAQWLRNLIAAGELPDGDVDERSIEDVRPRDLDGYTRCHFFAGIGGWGLALKWVDWPSSAGVVWTCGCPCQPFSAAGKRGGFADERHLWPAQFWLIDQCRPDVLLGEQVASRDGLAWLDLVQADMEASGYAGGAIDLCAAGFGAPHIRQRQWLTFERLADADRARLEGRIVSTERADQRLAGPGSVAGGLADDAFGGRREEHPHAGGRYARDSAQGLAAGLDTGGDTSGLADAESDSATQFTQQSKPENESRDALVLRAGDGAGSRNGGTSRTARDTAGTPRSSRSSKRPATATAGPVNGLWRASDWLYCLDGRWRPVEPGTFPLAHGVPGRVGRLRAYGETISPAVAAAVAEAYLIERGYR